MIATTAYIGNSRYLVQWDDDGGYPKPEVINTAFEEIGKQLFRDGMYAWKTWGPVFDQIDRKWQVGVEAKKRGDKL